MLWALGVILSELAEAVEGLDGALIGEDSIAVVVAHLLALGVEPPGVDCGLEAPGMEGKRKVVAHPWDVVLGGSLFQHRISIGAVGALHVFKFDDGDAGARGRLEGRGIVHGRGGRRIELGVHTGGREHGGGQAERKGHAAAGEAKGEGKISVHSGLDDSLIPIVTASNEESCRRSSTSEETAGASESDRT